MKSNVIACEFEIRSRRTCVINVLELENVSFWGRGFVAVCISIIFSVYEGKVPFLSH